jgi:putative nucleotidyltransferase with HDIG domain
MNFSPTYSSDLKRGIPSREECLALMEDQGMLPNIRSHSLQVARVAHTLTHHLLPAHPHLDMALVEAGALLHDIAKTECLKTKKRHTERGAEILIERGFPRLAEIVAQHVRLSDGHGNRKSVSEVEIVHYADKRVLHEDIVDLFTRFEDLKTRYGRTPRERELIEALYADSLKQEAKLFRLLPFAPQELSAHL